MFSDESTTDTIFKRQVIDWVSDTRPDVLRWFVFHVHQRLRDMNTNLKQEAFGVSWSRFNAEYWGERLCFLSDFWGDVDDVTRQLLRGQISIFHTVYCGGSESSPPPICLSHQLLFCCISDTVSVEGVFAAPSGWKGSFWPKPWNLDYYNTPAIATSRHINLDWNLKEYNFTLII